MTDITNIKLQLQKIEDNILELQKQLESKERVINLQRQQIKGLEEGISDYQKQIKELKGE